jgi:hypothetical protein
VKLFLTNILKVNEKIFGLKRRENKEKYIMSNFKIRAIK